MAGNSRDFRKSSDIEQRWLVENTWCDACRMADLGMQSPREYEENGRIYVEGNCTACGRVVTSEVSEKVSG